MNSLDEAPVSSRHVRIKIHNLANVPERQIEAMQIVTRVTEYDRAKTTVRLPRVNSDLRQSILYQEVLQALRYLEGVDSGIPFAGVSQEFEVIWDGICRPI